MPADIVDISELKSHLAPSQKLLGLDLGTKTIGIAVSDGLLMAATARRTLKRRKISRDGQELADLIAAENIGGVVLGLPLNMNGTEGPRAQSTRAFARNLAALIDVPICFWDERLSTVAAERALLEADMSRAKRAEVIDAAAAAFILQGALDRLRP